MIPERFDITPWNIDPALRYATVIDGLRDIWRDDITIAEIGSGAAGITEFLDHPVTGVDSAFERTDDKANPLKSKGLGELGICGAGAAVANAVYNATGIRIRDYPLTLDKVLDGFTARETGQRRA